MSYLDDIKFHYYPNNIKITKPLGTVSLREFVRAVSEPREEVKKLFEDIKKASAEGDLKKKAALKSGLYYFTPCVMMDGLGRGYQNIQNFLGTMQVDFDGLPDAPAFRDWIFENTKSCILAGVSSSGYGVKCLFRIPVVNTVEEFKEYFCGMAYYLEDFIGFDAAPFNCALPLYLFYDPDTRWREDATVSAVRGEKIGAFKKFDGEIEVLENVEPWKKQQVINMFSKGIDNITDNGHPSVVAYCSMIGGYCAAGYLSEDEAEVLIEERIYDNEYLSKDHEGYIKTAKTMLVRGMNSPLYLKEDEE